MDLDGSSGAPIFNVVLDHLTMSDSGEGEIQGDSASNSGRISMGGFEVERTPTDQIDLSDIGTHFPTAEEQSRLSTVMIAVADAT